MNLVLVVPPKPDPEPACYLRMFTAIAHGREKGHVLIDFPLSLGSVSERRWVPETWVRDL